MRCLFILTFVFISLHANAYKWEVLDAVTSEALRVEQIECFGQDGEVLVLKDTNEVVPEGWYDVVVKIEKRTIVHTARLAPRWRHMANLYFKTEYGLDTLNNVSIAFSYEEAARMKEGRDQNYAVVTNDLFFTGDSPNYIDIRIDSVYIGKEWSLKAYALYYTEKEVWHGDGMRIEPTITQTKKVLGVFNQKKVIQEGYATGFGSYRTYFKGDNSVERYVVSKYDKTDKGGGSISLMYFIVVPTSDLGLVKYETTGKELRWINYNQSRN